MCHKTAHCLKHRLHSSEVVRLKSSGGLEYLELYLKVQFSIYIPNVMIILILLRVRELFLHMSNPKLVCNASD